MHFKINLLGDGSVVTKDGVYLGTWGADETDAFYQFTPEGGTDPIISDTYMAPFCQRIEQWHESCLGCEAEFELATGG